ncbi:MAG: sigma-70 family RNA polymerase sigma factor [Phycisphaerae bacterium]|nr:sigma-70 family RNA polymerase sigma factor [Phycisphaerae bacterium]
MVVDSNSVELRRMINQARDGSPEGFEVILSAYSSRLYGYFFRATRSHHDAEDLLSELMLKLVRVIKKYDDRGKFEPWLFRIAANMVRDRIRHLKVRPKIASLSADKDGANPGANLRASTPAPDESSIKFDTQLQLQEALEKLDETTRQMVLMKHFGNLSFKEIAREFGCPIGTALAKVHRGLKTLRKVMAKKNEQ